MARLSEDPTSPPRLPELARLGLDDGLSQYLVDIALVVRVAADLTEGEINHAISTLMATRTTGP